MSNISFSGIGSGLDTKSIVNALVAAEIAPQREQLATRKTSLNTQISGIGRLKSAMSEFQRTLDQLKTAEKFQARSAQLSNDKNMAATASPTSAVGSYEISVEQLASAQKLTSPPGAFADATSALGSGQLSFTGSELLEDGSNGFTLTIDPSTSSLLDIRNAINASADNKFVTAAIVNVDGATPGTTEPRLILTARNPGSENAIQVTVGEDSEAAFQAFASTNLVETQAQDAIIKVNGLTATRSSNSITDVIAGVTLSLKEAEPGVSTLLTVGTDNEAIEKNVQAYVDAYNKLQGVIKDLNTERGGLKGDSTLRSLSISMRNLATGVVDTAVPNVNSLALVGVTIDREGKMSLDKSALNSRLASDFSSVAQLFTSAEGIAKRTESNLKSFTQTGGLLDNRTEGLNSRLNALRDNEDRLDLREESLFNRLSRQFNAMDSLVAQINSNGSFLVSQLNAMNASMR